ncbi:Phage-related protein [hydrothermal vent metagenome]|uniref:Phage-related protein n=1 Tax=hydrothermal vent metagenome TaxID=652676 RepID=A0A3B1E1T7_9ZZZZ
MDAFARIGINPNAYSDTESFFNATIDGLKNIKDEAARADLSKRLLGSADLNNLIDGGSEAIRKQKKELKELGVLIDNQDYKKSAKFNDTLQKTTAILKGLANKIFLKLMPVFTKLMEQFNGFLKANKDFLTSGLGNFLNIIIDSAQFIITLISRVVGHLGGVKTVLISILGLWALFNIPIVLAIGALVALFIAIDEIASYLKGEDSLIGDWLGLTGDYLKQEISNIGDYFSSLVSDIKNMFKEMVDWLVSLFDDIDIFGGISRQIDKVKKTVSDFMPDMPTLDGALSFIGLGGDDKKQPAQAYVDTNSTTPTSNITNNYNISADVNATNKNIGEALKELTNPAGY